MGTYLSTPVTDKCEESHEDLSGRPFPIAWGVVDMQGWRKSMEDAHIARTNVPLQEDDYDSGGGGSSIAETAKVFGVFDGHGGPEVARFCQLYLVSVLTHQSGWHKAVRENHEAVNNQTSSEENLALDPKQSSVGGALVEAFHALDRMIDDPSRR
jgi:serine/threonine protein phosphatase PrpC